MIVDETGINRAERLLRAMVPIDEVIDAFRSLTTTTKTDWSTVSAEEVTTIPPKNLEEQDNFAEVVSSCWDDDLGPSERYLKAVVRRYIALLEKDGIIPESEGLLGLVLRASLSKDTFPEPDESCYLSFCVPPSNEVVVSESPEESSLSSTTDNEHPLLRIRVFPYHNDVALRLWEAGTFLAEYFLQNPSLVADTKVIELGAGVGLTGLVIAGCCNASSVHLTDYTEECRINLDHNLHTNEQWLLETRGDVNVSQGYLEWSSFAESKKSDEPSTELSSDNNDSARYEQSSTSSNDYFSEAEVLIAADVVYDPSVISSLVHIVKSFLFGPKKEQKKAYFGMTKRNEASFNMFLSKLEEYGITYDWMAMGKESTYFRRVFPCRLNEKNSDVRVARLCPKMAM